MAISYEESKKRLQAQMAAAAPMLTAMPMIADTGVMTLDENSGGELIAAYSEWTRHPDYDWYEWYSDDKVSTVDENKNITMNPSQINLTQEENSQFIPFEMPQFYDGFDLARHARIWFYYKSSDGYEGASKAVNVSYDEATIRFAWLVDGDATHVAGNLKFEIWAVGTNEKSNAYVWKSKTYDKMNVMQSIINNKVIELDDSWVQELVTDIAESVASQIASQQIESLVQRAETAASEAEAAAGMAADAAKVALENYYDKSEIDQIVEDIDVSDQLVDYAKSADVYTKDEVDDLIEQIDVTDQLIDYAKTADVEKTLEDYALKTDIPSLDGYATETFVTDEIAKIDVTKELVDYAKTEDVNKTLESYALKTEIPSVDGLATEKFVTDEIAKIDVTEQLADYAKTDDVYNKTQTDELIDVVQDDVDVNTGDITTLKTAVQSINETLESVDKNPRVTYNATYGMVEKEDGTTQDNTFTLWETTTGGEPVVKSQFVIQGGGGASGGIVLKVKYLDDYPADIAVTAESEQALVKYSFTAKDEDGDTNIRAMASWKVGSRVVATQEVSTSDPETQQFDLWPYLSVGRNTIELTVSHSAASPAVRYWYINVVDMRLEGSFRDKYESGEPVEFVFTPYGSVDKVVHFWLDGEEIGTKESKASAATLSDRFVIPAQEHSAHLFEAYLTATISGREVTSNRIVHDIIWYDEDADKPVIATAQQKFTAKQYATTPIVFTVYDPTTETPTVTLSASYVNEDGETVVEYTNTRTLTDGNIDEWQYKTDVIGEHTLTITCGDADPKVIKATIEDIGINVAPVTAGLVFDLNPTGRSNSDADRSWSYGDIKMTVSPDFDWINGGWQTDENGDQYFGIKAGTSAEISYLLFGDDAKSNGKEMKLIFKTTNVASEDAVFMSCLSDATGTSPIGIEMQAHEATIYAMSESLPLPYSEEDIIEFEFNISTSDSSIPMVMGYEDGVSTRPMVYDATHDFQQHKDYRQTISLGSPDCDLRIYRFKVYNTSLSDRDILNNFIADARSAEEMVDRYTRNQIYKEGVLDPEYLAEVCPDLRILILEVPHFTTDKDDKVYDAAYPSTLRCIYKNGDPILDNWTAYDIVHSGQGTSSNNYGPAGRNQDFIMKSYKDYGNAPYIVLGDGSQTNKVALTRNSVPVNYLNLKVNIASSENANNALLAKRYDQFNPYQRPLVRDTDEDAAKVKDTMEFVNCVLFIREIHPDISTHVEFADNEIHFYGIGNIGDSKKTDDTRLTDPDDPYECILEVMDNTLPNSTMPTGKVDENGAPVYPIPVEEWTVGNSAYDSLYAEKFDEKKADEKENGLADTYGWRYIYEDGTDEENEEYRAFVENKWREFYGFVVTATDEEFKAHLGDYVVLDSFLFYYLFTLRYTMTDNHAKNSFYHYGKSNDVDSEGNPIRKWDLCFDYDNDTSLGIDNYGRMSYRYGYEEIDYVDGTSDWVWNAPQHVLFLRIRELFQEELAALYTELESLGCWNSTSLINQWNEHQQQWPEELWRLNIEREYIRTYTTSFIDGKAYPEFLKERANGRKKYQRAQFERSQEKYMSSKFGGTVASSDDVILRCSVPNTELAVQPNFNITLTPYAHMYLGVKYNTAPPELVRVKPDETYTFEYNADLADIIEIYSASNLKSIGDLSACYLINGTFANAEKIRELKLGSDVAGYDNPNEITLGFGENALLNKLDIQNMSGLTHSLNLSGLKNLEELYAFGTNTGGVIFADGGNIHTAEIPDVGSIQMKNLSYLDDDGFDAAGYNKLTRLVAENSELDLIALIEGAANLYQVRLVGIDWTLENTDLLERLYGLAGVNNTGGNADRAILSGRVFVPVIREKQLGDFNTAWPDLTINYNTLVNQFPVTFKNADGTVLEVQYVEKGQKPVDPVTREDNPIPTPVLESTVSTNYTYAGWNANFVDVFEPLTYTAVYTESIRQYTIIYQNDNIELSRTLANYGTVVPYEGELPTYTKEEGAYKYYLFSGWDQSGYVDGDKVIKPVFDSCEYAGGYYDGKDLEQMRPVEVYMLIKLSGEGVLNLSDIVAPASKLTLQMGSDMSFDPENEVLIIGERTNDANGNEVIPMHEGPLVFDGTNYFDTGISLMDVERDFCLAIDCKMDADNAASAVLAQCLSEYNASGFKLYYNNGAKVAWGSGEAAPISVGDREVIVIRHRAGELGAYVYASNVNGNEPYYMPMDGVHSMVHNVSLVFGCSKRENGTYYRYGKGTVYWSKLWYTDLGESACRKLAYWPHEELVFEACYSVSGMPTQYYLSDGSMNMSTLTLISSGVLPKPMVMNPSNVNSGGWTKYSLNAYLNSRVYNAFEDGWRQLMKQVEVKSTEGDKSNRTTSSNCYIFVPSIGELYGVIDPTFAGKPYSDEGEPISHFTKESDVICRLPDGTAVQYWTRSPSFSGTSSTSSYMYVIRANGSDYNVVSPNSTTTYVRIMLCM